MNKEIQVGYEMLEVMFKKRLGNEDKKIHFTKDQIELFASVLSSLYMIQLFDVDDLLLKDLQRVSKEAAEDFEHLDKILAMLTKLL